MFIKSKILVAGLGIVAMTAFGIGCGDDDGEGEGGGAYTSVDGSAEIGSLSDEQTTQICEDSRSYIPANPPSKDQACTFVGVFSAAFSAPDDDAAAQEACRTARDECLNEGPDTDDDDDCADFELPETCSATVDQYAACQKATIANQNDAVRNLPSCDELTLEDLEPTESQTLAACETYNAACAGDAS